MSGPENVKPYLTDRGRVFLEKWGIRLWWLYLGLNEPRTAAERHFVETFKKNGVPEGKSEQFWFDVQEVQKLIEKCIDLDEKLQTQLGVNKGLSARIAGQDNEIQKRIDPLEKEIERLNKALRGCWTKIKEYEEALGIEREDPSSKAGATCPLCRGTTGAGQCSRCDGRGYI